MRADLQSIYHKHSYLVKQLLAGIIVVSTILIIYNSATLIHNVLEYLSILFMLLLILGSVSGLKPYLSYLNLNKSEPRALDCLVAEMCGLLPKLYALCGSAFLSYAF